MFEVRIAPPAQVQFTGLPVVIQIRVATIFERLTFWPAVSGAKPLQHSLKGSYRIRTGAYRVVFTVNVPTKTVTVTKIDNRKDVYG